MAADRDVTRDLAKTRRVVVRHANRRPNPGAAKGLPTSRISAQPQPPAPSAELGPPEVVETAEVAEPAEVAETAEVSETAGTLEVAPETVEAPEAGPVVAETPAPAAAGVAEPVEETRPDETPPVERPPGFPTEALLAGQGAEADDLRAQLDELRRQLDAPLTPRPTPSRRRSARKPLLGVLVAGGTIAAITTGVLVPWSDLSLPGRNGTTTPGSTGARPAGANPLTPAQPSPFTVTPPVPNRPAAQAQPAVPAGPAAAAPRSVPAGRLPTTGPGIDQPGTMLLVDIDSDGSLNVVEQAVLGPRGLRQLRLALPSLTSLGGEVARLRPTVSDLRVAVNGTPVAVPAGADGWTVTTDAARARTVRLSYTLSSSLPRPGNSLSRRELAVSVPLLAQTLRAQGLPYVVRVAGSNIRNVSCLSAARSQILCGRQDATGWTAPVPSTVTVPALLLLIDL
jgi:hypothetical protein